MFIAGGVAGAASVFGNYIFTFIGVLDKFLPQLILLWMSLKLTCKDSIQRNIRTPSIVRYKFTRMKGLKDFIKEQFLDLLELSWM